MVKRKEERDMIDTLRRQLTEKDDTIRRLAGGASGQPSPTVRGVCARALLHDSIHNISIHTRIFVHEESTAFL